MNCEKLFQYIESNQNDFIKDLKLWVAIKSVSASPELRSECFKMIDLVAKMLEKEGCKVEIIQNPKKNQILINGDSIELPPILIATYGNDPKLKTVCIYGHVDVQPAQKSDGWKTDPFEMVTIGDEMYGRGTSDDKGPVLGWICMLRAFNHLKITPNVNIKFIFECMEESGSVGLFEFLTEQKEKFLKDVDFICISDNTWIGTKKPCLTYGLRGVVHFYLQISGPKKDLHSGIFGGTIKEPMTDLVNILSRLVDQNGHILIPNIYDKVPEFSDIEKKSYEGIEFDTNSYLEDIKCESKNINSDSKIDILAKRWRYPSLSIHGIEGAFSESGFKTVIPSKVIGKFSIRIVPNMGVEEVKQLVKIYVDKLVKEMDIKNDILLESDGAPAWLSDTEHPNYKAAIKATKKVFGIEPDLTREGGSIPVTLMFEHTTKKNVVLIPMGRADDGAHSQNEKLNISNLISGMKTFTSYVDELGKI